jgi:hypothetical protein
VSRRRKGEINSATNEGIEKALGNYLKERSVKSAEQERTND